MADLRPIFIDIDGTLTNKPGGRWGTPILRRLKKVRQMIRDGQTVVIWTGGGQEYANEFCRHYGLNGAIALGKPELIVDDNPRIRPPERMPILSPEEFFK